jgi:hypothetical protein
MVGTVPDIGLDSIRQPRRTLVDGGDIMGIELLVFATIFTLIVLLTGGPGNTL